VSGTLRIVAVFTAAAVLYGLLHDQVTARVCLEYFTVAHRPIARSSSATVLGAVWALVAAAPAGIFAGTLVSLAARDGLGPKLEWRRFVRPLLRLAAMTAGAAMLAGLAGYVLTARGAVRMIADYAHVITPPRQPRFMAVVYAHIASFTAGITGTLVIAVRAQALRARLRVERHGVA